MYSRTHRQILDRVLEWKAPVFGVRYLWTESFSSRLACSMGLENSQRYSGRSRLHSRKRALSRTSVIPASYQTILTYSIKGLDRSSFVLTYPDLNPYDEAKVLNLFNQTVQGPPQDKAIGELNETGTGRDGQPDNPKFRIKLQNFGSRTLPHEKPAAFFEADVKDGQTPSTKLLRECPPPELALNEPYSRASDIWYAAIQVSHARTTSLTCSFDLHIFKHL